MEREKNNMFKYATKELSQDAFICWCVNWINYPNNEMYHLGKDFLEMMLTDEKGNKKIEITKKTSVKILRQYEKIDILLVIDNKYLVIIEDKVNSFNHGQISSNIGEKDKVYKYKLINLLDEVVKVDKNGEFHNDGKKDIDKVHKKWEEIGLESFIANNIVEVYVKSGILTRLDEAVHAIKIDTNKILNVLSSYTEKSEIVRDFYECLKFKVDLIDDNKVEKIIENGELEIGTKFRYRSMCYNCFFKTTQEYFTSDFDENMNLRLKAGGMDLTENIAIWIPKLFKQKKWINTLDEENGLIIEENTVEDIKEKCTPKYKYVFVRKIDEFADEYFEFVGVFTLYKVENERKRIWKKLDLGKFVTLNINEIEHTIHDQ